MEKMYIVFVHIGLIKICSSEWAKCGKKLTTKIKETTTKTVQFIAEKIVRTAHWSWRLVSNLSYSMNSKQMQRIEVQENNFQFYQYYYFKQRK